jgi:hypothetical protein
MLGYPFSFVGQKRGEGCEGASGLADGPDFEPVAQKHDRDQEGELPPELEVEPSDGGRQARDERDNDREGDEEHHPRLARFYFIPATFEEDSPSIKEDDGAENRRDGIAAGEVRHREAEPILDHVAVEHDGDGKQEADPESATEDVRVEGTRDYFCTG